MSTDDAEPARLFGDYIAELERERAFATELACDLETVSQLLAEALAVIQKQTARLSKQSHQINRLMGLGDNGTGWHAPIRLVDVADVEIPEQMTRASEIRWTPFGGQTR